MMFIINFNMPFNVSLSHNNSSKKPIFLVVILIKSFILCVARNAARFSSSAWSVCRPAGLPVGAGIPWPIRYNYSRASRSAAVIVMCLSSRDQYTEIASLPVKRKPFAACKSTNLPFSVHGVILNCPKTILHTKLILQLSESHLFYRTYSHFDSHRLYMCTISPEQIHAFLIPIITWIYKYF